MQESDGYPESESGIGWLCRTRINASTEIVIDVLSVSVVTTRQNRIHYKVISVARSF